MDEPERRRRRQVFGQAVDAYDAIRPDYPEVAVHWALGEPDDALTVADLGAGTGKLTARLLELGHRVVAVEPDETMLDRLRANHAAAMLRVRVGTAEDPPLADAEVDAVVAGQAWHWFDQDAVAEQLARVVRPGGIAAALWNTRDADVDWVARWQDIVHEADHPTGSALLAGVGGPDFGDAFGGSEHRTFAHVQPMAPGDLVDLAASRSHTIALPADERAAMLDEVADFAATHPDLLGRDRVDLPLDTEVFRARHA